MYARYTKKPRAYMEKSINTSVRGGERVITSTALSETSARKFRLLTPRDDKFIETLVNALNGSERELI